MKIPSILILDDDPISILVYTETIKDMNIADLIISFENGYDAIEFLKTFTPSLIFVDLRMPQMDGLTFIEELNKIKVEGKDYNVITVTAHINFIQRLRLQDLGVEDFLIKPFDKEKIMILIKKYFPLI